MGNDGLTHTIRDFIIRSFVPEEKPDNLTDSLDLIKSGILDSLALVQTAGFLEELAGTEIESHELTPANVGSIGAMAAFVTRRRAES